MKGIKTKVISVIAVYTIIFKILALLRRVFSSLKLNITNKLFLYIVYIITFNRQNYLSPRSHTSIFRKKRQIRLSLNTYTVHTVESVLMADQCTKDFVGYPYPQIFVPTNV